MEAVLDPIRDLVEGSIDFEGQRIAEIFSTVLLTLTSVIALVTGYMAQDIYLTLGIGLAGVVLTMLVVVPPWPAFNEHPEPWLPSGKGLSGLPPGGIIIEQSKDK